MKVAVIDNIDSFVYNLVQYVGELGMEPFVFQKNSSLEKIQEVNPDKIIISPGPGRPEDSDVSIEVVNAFSEEVPILGVCLGHQIIGYAFGGEVDSSEQLMHGKLSVVKHDDSLIYTGVPNPFEATRYHSLALKDSSLPGCFRVTARTGDEFGEIMGIEHKEFPLLGVQFHPESILTIHGKTILKNFLEEV